MQAAAARADSSELSASGSADASSDSHDDESEDARDALLSSHISLTEVRKAMAPPACRRCSCA